jgi:hypothetical protein
MARRFTYLEAPNVCMLLLTSEVSIQCLRHIYINFRSIFLTGCKLVLLRVSFLIWIIWGKFCCQVHNIAVI